MANRDSMKKPDFLSDADWAHVRDQTSSLERIRSDGKVDVADYLANPDGRASGKGPSGLPTLLLTTVGRKSGEPRTVALVFLQHGEDMVIVASLAGYDQHPAWYLNLQADPRCRVQRDRHQTAAVARTANDAERRDLWPKLNAVLPLWGHFQSGTDRPFPIVILSPTGDA
ncbi:MAG: nitroreductase family deazaflavin-dependent oxidoreductase [Deltaproteobacteria bacterium]|nr:nitroreductase family deazaflavin-dependent oxidoreductase [Deltaproteobacteria bacterium]